MMRDAGLPRRAKIRSSAEPLMPSIDTSQTPIQEGADLSLLHSWLLWYSRVALGSWVSLDHRHSIYGWAVAPAGAQDYPRDAWVRAPATFDGFAGGQRVGGHEALAAHGRSRASHRERRGARLSTSSRRPEQVEGRLARRAEGEYREYSTEVQRSQSGCIVGRMQRDLPRAARVPRTSGTTGCGCRRGSI